MNSLSTMVLLSGIGWVGGIRDLAHPVAFGLVIDLGAGIQLFQQAEARRVFRRLGGSAGLVVQVAELNRLRGAGLRARGRVFHWFGIRLSFGYRALLGCM